MKLELTEEQLTVIIQTAFEHYAQKPFGHATFTQTDNGIVVQFHDADERTEVPTIGDLLVSPLSPFISFSGSGGSSGGAGASGGW